MQKFVTMIVNKLKDAKLFASQGGPIILAQVLLFDSIQTLLHFLSLCILIMA